jgi:hypothetical protein
MPLVSYIKVICFNFNTYTNFSNIGLKPNKIMMISIGFKRFGESIKFDLSYQKRQLDKSYLIDANVGFDKAKYAALYLIQLTV